MTAGHSSYCELARAARRPWIPGRPCRGAAGAPDRPGSPRPAPGPRALPGRGSHASRHDPAGPLPPGSRRRHPHHPPARADLRRPRRRPHRPDRTTRSLTTRGPARRQTRLVSPDAPFTCGDYRWTWPGVGRCLPLLAPNLAPRNLLSAANVRYLELIDGRAATTWRLRTLAPASARVVASQSREQMTVNQSMAAGRP